MKTNLAGIILCAIGDELLDGRIKDRNIAGWGVLCADRGMTVRQGLLLPDDPQIMAYTMRELRAAYPATGILCFGGLGPTPDDLTSEVAAQVLGCTLKEDPQQREILENKYRLLGMNMSPNNLKQVSIPDRCSSLSNPNGTAPGWFGLDGQGFVAALPGPPHENRAMAEEFWSSVETNFVTEPRKPGVMLRSFGCTESRFAARVSAILASFPEVEFHDRFHFPEIELLLQSHNPEQLAAAVEKIRELPEIYGVESPSLPELVVQNLKAQGKKLAVAESCTGGLLGQMVTNTAGASEVFPGGVIAYSNLIKQQILGVDAQLLEEQGAVSEAVACAMASQVREKFGADYGIAITGIAGPGGGSADKPAGTTWIAWSSEQGVQAECFRFRWDRAHNRLASAWSALYGLHTRMGSPLTPNEL